MALLAWSYCSSVLLPVWDLFLHQSYAKGWMRTPEYCLQWDSTAWCWDKHDASHTWMDSLTLRLCVWLISFLNWGPVYGTFAGMNKVRQLKPLMLGWNLPFGHRSPASRKCFTGLFRRKEEALQYSRDPKEGWPCWVAGFFFAFAMSLLDCFCITDKERNPGVWWQNKSWVKTHKHFHSCCETTCCTFSSRQFLAWGWYAPQVLFNIILCYSCFCWFV